MQEQYTINPGANQIILRPDGGLTHSFETTYSSDSTRSQNGVGHFTNMFTVESFGYKESGMSKQKMSQILQAVAPGRTFIFHYYSPFYGTWRDDEFYVGKGSLVIGELPEGAELFTSLSFNIIGVNPVYTTGGT